MAEIEIEGIGTVEVDDAFRQLSPEQQAATVDEIVGQMQPRQPQQAQQAQGVPQSSLGEALAIGAIRGSSAEFADELEATRQANLAISEGDNRPFDQIFAEKIAPLRAQQQRLETEHPTATLIGQVGGALINPATRFLGRGAGAGASLGQRVAVGGAGGTAAGAAFGAGASEGGILERASDAALSSVFGGVLGIGGPLTLEAARLASRGVMSLGRGLFNRAQTLTDVDAQAARQVAGSIEADRALGQGLSTDQALAAQRQGLPVRTIDLGGEQTRALARSAANQSPEARARLNRTINDRFESQGARTSEYLRTLTGAQNAATTRDELFSAARRANKPAYERAYRDGESVSIARLEGNAEAQGIIDFFQQRFGIDVAKRSTNGLWSPELQRLSGAEIVLQAMRNVAKTGKDRAIADGFGAFRTGVRISDTGVVEFVRGPRGVPTFPNLQFWDYVKRELDDAAGRAYRQGANDQGGTISRLARGLRTELDRLVPSYAPARAGAARFFQAEDALEAGENFVRLTVDNNAARRAVERMSGAERQLFMEGFTDSLIRQIERSGDRRNVIQQVFGNEAMRQKMQIALGSQRSRMLEARIRVEQLMDLARNAVQGNSTTTRQLVELGIIGGAGGFAFSGGDAVTGLVTGALTFVAGRGVRSAAQRLRSRATERMAQSIARQLVDPDVREAQQVIRRIADNPRMLDSLRQFDAQIIAAGATQAPAVAQSVEAAIQ